MYRNHSRTGPTSVIALMVGLSALPAFASVDIGTPPDIQGFIMADLTDMDSVDQPFTTRFATALQQGTAFDDYAPEDVVTATAVLRQLDEIIAGPQHHRLDGVNHVTVQLRDDINSGEDLAVTYCIGDQTFERQIGKVERASAQTWLQDVIGESNEEAGDMVTMATALSAKAPTAPWAARRSDVHRTGYGARITAMTAAFQQRVAQVLGAVRLALQRRDGTIAAT